MIGPLPDAGDVVVVGAPRSGTSLVSQLLAGAGFHFGANLLPATQANPLGFLEDVEVSQLNDALLEPHVVGQGPGQVPEVTYAWLAVPGPDLAVEATDLQRDVMTRLLPEAPAGLKDPRFTATLDAWRPALRSGTSFVAVVRDPAEVAVSLQAMWSDDPGYYSDFEVTLQRGLAVWEAANLRILRLRHEGRWFMADHASLLDGTGVAPLGRFVGGLLDDGQVQRRLHRSRPGAIVPQALGCLYQELCVLAGSDRQRWSDG